MWLQINQQMRVMVKEEEANGKMKERKEGLPNTSRKGTSLNNSSD